MKHQKANSEEVASKIQTATEDEQQDIKKVLAKFEELFDGTLGVWNCKPVELELKDPNCKPAHAKPHPVPQSQERKLKQEQASLEYEFRLVTAEKEAEKLRIEAQGKADANRILSASLTDKILRDKGIEATLQLSNSPNSKVIVVGSSKDGLPLILGNN